MARTLLAGGGVVAALLVSANAMAAPLAPPPVARYGDPVAAPPRTALVARAEKTIQSLARAGGHAVPAVEPRLEAALQLALDAGPRGTPPPMERMSQALWLAGDVDPLPYLLLITVHSGDERDLVAQLDDNVPKLLAAGSYRKLGVATAATGPDELAVLVAVQESLVELDPIPRALPSGGTVAIAGRLVAPAHGPELFATAPDGSTQRLAVTEHGESFRGELTCGADGRHQIEVVAASRFGSTVVANFPIHCGSPAPRAIATATLAPVTFDGDAAAAEARLLALVNRDRARAGLAAVTLDPSLTKVARGHSFDMRDHHFVGHTSPTTGGPSDRVLRAGLPKPRLLVENVAAGYSPEQVEQSFLDSPAHRANLLDPGVDRVGLAVAISVDGEQRELFVTQLFARFPSPGDAGVAAARLHQLSDTVRRTAHAALLGEDPALDRLAYAIAQGMASGSGDKGEPDAPVKAAMPSLSQRYGSLRTVVAVAGDVAELSLPPAVAEARLTDAGYAAVAGTRDGDPVLYCVVLLAARWPAPPPPNLGQPSLPPSGR